MSKGLHKGIRQSMQSRPTQKLGTSTVDLRGLVVVQTFGGNGTLYSARSVFTSYVGVFHEPQVGCRGVS